AGSNRSSHGGTKWLKPSIILPPQPTSAAPGDFTLSNVRNGGHSRIGGRSPDAKFACFRSEIADSLRRIFEIFPFSGDSERRPGSIYTAWSVKRPYPRFESLSLRQPRQAQGLVQIRGLT